MSPATMSPAGAPPANTDIAGATFADVEPRVFRGRSIDELIPQIEAELGADAIVVRRRRGLEGGIGGFFQRPFVEVEAKPGTPRVDRYDEDPEPALPPAQSDAPIPAVPRPAGAYVTDALATIAAAAGADQRAEVRAFRAAPAMPAETAPTMPARTARTMPAETAPAMPAETMPAASSAPAIEDPFMPSSAEQTTEFRELTPDTFAGALAEAVAMPAPTEIPSPAGTEALAPSFAPISSSLSPMPLTPSPAPAVLPRHERARAGIEQGLLDVGMSADFARELVDMAIAHELPFAPRIGLAKAVHAALSARIPRAPLLPAPSATLAVVGPGGAGKTSCCAALLSTYRKAEVLPASCATIMLAQEREELSMLLSPYAMEPLPVASARARQVLAGARAQGLLLVDLPPLSRADRSAVRRIAALLGELGVDRTMVALPATLGATAAAQLLGALSPLRATGVAITHADETDQLGVAVEAACRFGLAPEYLLGRSRARTGLSRIDPTQLADRLLTS
jgi:flagellar biosynthesis GTPase FlhF